MIDAYEIGIQLLLQEDVSAGLEVINRGLAGVDKAIAATSTNLAGLVNKAEAATKAVAVAMGGRATLPAAAGQTSGEPLEQPVTKQVAAKRDAWPPGPRDEAGTTSSAPLVEKGAAPDVRAAEPPVPTKQMAAQANQAELRPRAATPEQTVASSAPTKNDATQMVENDQLASKTQAGSETPVYTVLAPAAPTLSSVGDLGKAPVRNVPGPAPEPRRSEKSSAPPVALTASVIPAQRPATAKSQPERSRHQPTAGLAVQPERPVAPWSGANYSDRQAEATRLHGNAATPQPASRNENDSGGGTVMLDGRLVGQWLSEHMAREASRPPSGTSFFDPRQTPAWNVAGAL